MEEEAERNLAMKEVLAKLTKVHKVQVVEKEKQELRRKNDQEGKEKQKRQKRRVGRPNRKDGYYIPSVPKNDPSLTVGQKFETADNWENGNCVISLSKYV